MSAQARRQLAVLICWSTVLVWSTSWAGSSSSSYRISFLSISESWIGFPGDSDGKESACKAGDAALIPRSGRSSGGGSGNPLQCSCLENPVDRGAKWATVHGCKRVGHAWLSVPTWIRDHVHGSSLVKSASLSCRWSVSLKGETVRDKCEFQCILPLPHFWSIFIPTVCPAETITSVRCKGNSLA